MSVPVWTYWEGPLPAWVAAARGTIGAHARDHRALDPAGFDALRDRDRDLDLAPLYVAHRADVIRAFLLARYGGLWVDADCIVLCDLDALLASFAPYDFVAYREREGNVNNAFVYAPPGSATAAAWYARVCEVLRAGTERGWRSLGADAIAHAMAAVDAPRHVLGSELVQPIPWSEPQRFFATGGAAEHAARFNGRALCYMLSNQAAGGYAGANPGLAIDAPDTFFRYLLDRAAAPAGRPPSEGSTRVSSSTWHHIPFCVDALLDIAPMRVLDIGIGFGRWGMLVREFCDEWKGRSHRENWRVWLEGIEAHAPNVEDYHHQFYNWIHVGDAADVLERLPAPWDLIVLGDVLEHFEKTAGRRVLESALARAAYVLVNVPLGEHWERDEAENPWDRHLARWDRDELLAYDPVRQAYFTELWGRDYGAFVLSRDDPANLRAKATA